MNGDEITARFIARARWREFPEAVQEKAKMALMDNLCAAVSGTRAEVGRIGARFASTSMPGEEATIILQGKKSTAAGAAFANGCAANGLDTDDSARYAHGHAGAQLFPAALAVAEARGLSGERLLSGLTAGYEVAHRFGYCRHDDHDIYQACGSWGSVACAAAAAHLMDLPEDRIRHALGIADYHAPNLPMMRDIAHPAMVKHGIGWAALTGIHAAELASFGFTGIPSLLSRDTYAEWVGTIGEEFLMLEGVSWKAKRYACCGWTHAAVEGAKKLYDTYSFSPEEIEKIEIVTFDQGAALGAKLPETSEEAQFNMAWPVAAMLVDGEVGPEQTLEYRLSDEHIRELAGKVEITESEELNRLRRLFDKGDPKGRFAGEVLITLKDGSILESGRMEGGLSFPQDPPWSRADMEEKFRWLVEPVVGPERTAELIDMVWRFDELDSVQKLTSVLA
jgi:2-methylcitrate dehydratase PrpD